MRRAAARGSIASRHQLEKRAAACGIQLPSALHAVEPPKEEEEEKEGLGENSGEANPNMAARRLTELQGDAIADAAASSFSRRRAEARSSDLNDPADRNSGRAGPMQYVWDLLYLMLDKADPSSDRRLARHLVSLYYPIEDLRAAHKPPPYELSDVTAYISHAKKNVHPRLSDESIVELKAGWLAMRRLGTVGAKKIVTATARQLESLIR